MIFIHRLKTEADQDFIESMYFRFYGAMKTQILKITHSPSLVEDLIHDAIIRFIPKVELLKTIAEPQQMLYAITTAKRLSIDHMRRKSTREKWAYYFEEENFPSAESLYVQLERDTQLRSAMSSLSERDRDILLYTYLLEMNKTAICHTLGIRRKDYQKCLDNSAQQLASYLREET